MANAKKLIQENLQSKNPILDLGNCGLDGTETELDLLAECTHLQTLIFSTKWDEYDEEKQGNVRKASQNEGQNNKLTQLPSHLPKEINKLVLAGEYFDIWEIQDIDALQHLTGLQTLDLSYNQIQDISPLKDLKNLQRLNLSYNQIQDISLENFENLTEIKLGNNPLKSLSLKNFPKIEKLHLSRLKIEHIELFDLKNLQTLDLSYNQIRDIDALQHLTGLQTLYLSDNQIRNIDALQHLTGLQTLYLKYNPIQDIDALQHLTGLQALYLSATQIRNIDALQHLTGLQALYLSTTQIRNIDALQHLTGLQTLYLSDTQIRDISPLKDLENLVELSLKGHPFYEKLPKEIQAKDGREILQYWIDRQIAKPVRWVDKLIAFIRQRCLEISDLNSSTDAKKMILTIDKNLPSLSVRAIILLLCGTLIVCIGLDLNSELIVTTGAVVTPIISSILGLGLFMTINDLKGVIYALEHLILRLVIIVIVSSIYFTLTPFGELNSQILTWSQNNFLNIFIAFFAGFIVMLSRSNNNENVAFANILIAPVINVIGYGIANLNLIIILNSLYYLFLHVFLVYFALYLGFSYLGLPLLMTPTIRIKRYRRILFVILVIIILPSLFFVYDSYHQKNINTTLKRLEGAFNKVKEEKVIKINKSSQLSKAKEKVVEVFLVDDKAFSDSLIKAQAKELEKINYKLIVHRMSTSEEVKTRRKKVRDKLDKLEKLAFQRQESIQKISKKLEKNNFNQNKVARGQDE